MPTVAVGVGGTRVAVAVGRAVTVGFAGWVGTATGRHVKAPCTRTLFSGHTANGPAAGVSASWQKVPEQDSFDNAFKIQWELFLRHVVKDEPFRWGLLEGAKGVQLAEAGIASWQKRAWVDIPKLTP